MQYKKLFEPVSIGSMELKNRMYMPPMGDRYARNGYVTDQQIAYYEARAKGGLGLIITGWAYVDFALGRWSGPGGAPMLKSVDDDRFIPGLTKLAQAIKKHGAGAAIQISHAGPHAPKAYQTVGPSVVRDLPSDTWLPRALTVEEIKKIERQYVRGAERAAKAGFDAVEVHGGWLVGAFLSTAANKRQDEYGGSLANKMRFLLEIISGIKQTLGKDYPVWCRISPEEREVEGGRTLADGQEMARMLEDIGVDAIHIQGGVGVPHLPAGPGHGIPYAEALKKAVKVPILEAGWNTPELGENALLQQKADLIGFGRAVIVDPDFPNKLAAGKVSEIRPCIRCGVCGGERDNHKMLLWGQGGIECSGNPFVGREREFIITPAPTPKKVLVVGGGPGGMEAAAVAASRGHRVTLCEKGNKLGGQLPIASVAPTKEPIRDLIVYLEAQLKRHGVDIKLGTEVTAKTVASMSPDVVIVATGSKPLVPEIPGVRGDNVVTAESVLDGRAKVGKKVAIIGAELVGCETADFLADQGKKVTLLRRGQRIATTVNHRGRPALLKRLQLKQVQALAGVSYESFTSEGVNVVTADGKRMLVEADTIVLAAGAVPNNVLFDSLESSGVPVHRIGDCVEPRRIKDAIREGAEIGAWI